MTGNDRLPRGPQPPAVGDGGPVMAPMFFMVCTVQPSSVWQQMSSSRRLLFDEHASNADNTVLRCLRESEHGQGFSGGIMASSGELIRMMNYVDDISTTLRRIVVGSGFISPEERKKLADYMRNSDPNFTSMVEELEK